ncbi:MAG: hypothetical protein O3B01_04550 [Planctomycetota bacterium]|nr:hypothetical protein [Planctomycetota bacterium]
MLSNLSRQDWLLFLVILSAGVWAKMSHLERVGVRTADEGSYCFFGMTMLNGEPKCIQDKPGQAVILAAGFLLFGPSQYGAVAITALLGVLTIPALYWLGLEMGSKLYAVVLSAVSACLPYLLYYHRGASSDSNYFLFCVLGLALFLRAVRQGPAREEGDSESSRFCLKWLAASGLFWGVGVTVNLAAIPPYGIVWLFLGVLCKWNNIGLKRTAIALAVLGGAGLVGMAIVELPIIKFINMDRVWGQIGGHGRHILETTLRFEWARHLWMFFGPVGILLSIAGILNYRKWWKTPLALFPFLAVVLILFYMRGQLQLPRLHLPILIPLLPLMAIGVESFMELLRKHWKPIPDLTVQICAAVAFIGLHLPEAYRIQRLESGYPSACNWLLKNMEDTDMGLGTHTFWTFATFTRHPFAPDENRLTDALNGDDWEKATARQLREYAFTHNRKWLVVDYLILNRLYDPYKTKVKLPGFERMRQMLEKYPPDKHGGAVFANPIASDYQTHREDELLPDLQNEPMARYIYIYRIPDLVRAMSGS